MVVGQFSASFGCGQRWTYSSVLDELAGVFARAALDWLLKEPPAREPRQESGESDQEGRRHRLPMTTAPLHSVTGCESIPAHDRLDEDAAIRHLVMG